MKSYLSSYSGRLGSAVALLTLFAGLSLGSCSGQTVHAEKTEAAPPERSDLIARVGDIAITLK